MFHRLLYHSSVCTGLLYAGLAFVSGVRHDQVNFHMMVCFSSFFFWRALREADKR